MPEAIDLLAAAITQIRNTKEDDSPAWQRFRTNLSETSPGTGEIFKITPGLAKCILANCAMENRRLRDKTVRKFAAAMETEQWDLNGETIQFDRNGKMINGYHRMLACIRSNAAFKTYIIFGFDPSVFKTIDTGANRNLADTLHVLGYKNTSLLSATLTWAHAFCTDTMGQHQSIRNLDAQNYLAVYPNVSDTYADAYAIYERTGIPKGVAGGWIYAIRRINKRKADDLIEAWRRGETTGSYKVLHYVTASLLRRKAQTLKNVVGTAVAATTLTLVWNTFLSGNKGHNKMFDEAERTVCPPLKKSRSASDIED